MDNERIEDEFQEVISKRSQEQNDVMDMNSREERDKRSFSHG